MKAKIERGSGFRGVLNYGLGKEGGNACEIIGGNMSGTDPQTLAAEFALSREARPGVARPVWHTSLTLPKGEHLDSDKWSEIVADFMEGMGLADHQHVVIRHHDTEFDHVHIVASRISLDGGLWHGRFDAKRAIALTQELEQKHDLTRTKGLDAPSPKKAPTRQEVERSIRTEEAPPRLVLQEIVNAALSEPGSVFDFMDRIEAAGAVARPNVARTGKMNGFSFEYAGIPFKGSDLGKAYTWKGLQGRGITYDQDRDGAALRERAGAAIAGASEIDSRRADAVDTSTGPVGRGSDPSDGGTAGSGPADGGRDENLAAQASESITKAQQEAETILTRATATLIRTEESVQTAEKAAKSAAGQAVKASKMIEAQASRLRLTVILAAGACGLLIGMASLLGLLIWRPVLIQYLWQIAGP